MAEYAVIGTLTREVYTQGSNADCMRYIQEKFPAKSNKNHAVLKEPLKKLKIEEAKRWGAKAFKEVTK